MIFIYSISYDELSIHKQKGALLIDIRSYNDFLAFHIPGSQPIHSFKVLPRHKPIIFICEHGQTAKNYAIHYRNYYYECYYLEGGISLYQTMYKAHTYY